MEEYKYYKSVYNNDEDSPVFYRRCGANFRTSNTICILKDGEWCRSSYMDYEFVNFLQANPLTTFELTEEEIEAVLVMVELVSKPKEENFFELSQLNKIREGIADAVKIPIRYLFGEDNDKT